jgi:hypothetical protein
MEIRQVRRADAPLQETHWSKAFQMLPLRSEFQPKRPPCPAFEASPVIPIHARQVFSEEIKKVIIQRLTPVLAVIWLRSFCAVTLRSKAPQTPHNEEKVTKSATTAEK